MTVLQYLTSKEFGCATSGEILALNKTDPDAVKQLRVYAIAEMEAKGIPIDQPKKDS